jgi:hypothetical protein
MPHTTDLLIGANLVDIDNADATYTYLGFTRNDKSYIIMRQRNDGTEIRYDIGGNDYDVAWANHKTLPNYKRPDQFQSLS